MLLVQLGKGIAAKTKIGTPYCLTVDFDSLEDNSVTIRDRDTMNQRKVSLDKVKSYQLKDSKSFKIFIPRS